MVLVQESKINSGEERMVKDIWGSKHINKATLKAASALGGIFLLWDAHKVNSEVGV